MGTGIICGNEACGMELDPDPPSGRQPCPACGSMARTETAAPESVPVVEEPRAPEIPTFQTAFRESGELHQPAVDAKPVDKGPGRGSAKVKSGAKKKPAAKKQAPKKPAKKKSPAKKPAAKKSPKKKPAAKKSPKKAKARK